MKNPKTWIAITGAFILLIFGGLMVVTRNEAHKMVADPNRAAFEEDPTDYDLPFEDVTVTTADGLNLVGWFVPSENGAVVIAQHGYASNRSKLLQEAEMLYRHGYGVLLSTMRTHDLSEGEIISFGYYEIQDLEAWYQYLLTRDDIDHERIGILGNSLGGMLSIQYAARNDQIKAVVTNSAFSSIEDTVATSVEFFTGLPAFPFAPMIQFWAEQEIGGGIDVSEMDATIWIQEISPRPVFLMQGGEDVVISADSGQRLYDAAGEPKELWYEPELGHTDFDKAMPEEYERRVVAFYDQYLLGE